jgi:hypothetical protein
VEYVVMSTLYGTNGAGSKIIGAKPKLSEDQIAVIELCKETLAQALAGEITSVGIVACMKGGYAHVMAGRQAADLNMGCDSLKLAILETVEKAGSQKAAEWLK